MSQTAYSQHFARELDFKQLLKLRNITAFLDQSDYGISQTERDWLKGDLLCPSCRCGGATLVRSDVARAGGKGTRQAHFRFIDTAGHTAHKLGCDFFSMEDVPGVQKGTDVQFAANDKDAKVVRDLVCKAITAGELSKSDIFDMRSWFLEQRNANAFEVSGTPAVIDWMWAVRRLAYDALRFEPFHLSMPGFNARHAAMRELSARYLELRKQMPRVRFDAPERERAKRILVAQQGQRLISMEPLRPKLERTTRLALLMTDYGDLRLVKRKSLGAIYSEVSEAMLAFSAVVLFVSGWDDQVAFSRFARIIAAPPAEDSTLGNVIGLNPFHDFAPLEIARFASGLPSSTERTYDFDAELAAVLVMIEGARGSPAAEV